MFKTLILIDNQFVDYSLNLIDVACKLADGMETAIYGLGINLSGNIPLLGLDYLIQVDVSDAELKDSRVVTDILEQVHRYYHFDSILILATDYGRMIAPRLAMRLDVGLVADITDVIVDKQGRKLVRPAYSGNMIANIVCESTPIMASIRPNVFHYVNVSKKTPIKINFMVEKLRTSSIKVLSIVDQNLNKDIRNSKVIVAAGGGFNQTVSALYDLANKLHGAVAVSKQLVDQNKATREIQIGQSGKIVSPNLYIAIGIYGAIHHVEGLKNVKHIISVNTDINAPMNHLAELVVVGDGVEFLNKLTKKIIKLEGKINGN